VQHSHVSSQRPGVRTALLLVGTWLVGAAIAVVVGFFAVARVGDDLTEGGTVPISDEELRQAAQRASSSPPTSTPPTTATSSASSSSAVPPPEDEAETPPPATKPKPPPPAAQSRRFTTEGGVVAASCSGAAITLQYAYPNNGYTGEVSKSTERIEVEFHSPAGEEHVKLSCVGGVPTLRQEESEKEDGG
jgi:cytoskeletal protein RodZ